MTDFRARPALLLRDEATWETLRLSPHGASGDEEGRRAQAALLERVRAALPPGVTAERAAPRYADLIDPPGPEPFAEGAPTTLEGLVRPETHWDRLRTARDRLRDAGAEGAAELLSAPSGWVRLMEGLSEGLSELLEAEPGARLHLRQVKEKFGTLRVYASVEGSDAFRAAAREVTDWATAASERRCALTGRPGMLDPEGWFLVLSPEATVWRRAEPDAFHRAIYPPRPRPEPEAPAP